MGILDTPIILRETQGAKLRRLAAAAKRGNPYSTSRPPMKALLAWQPNTIYLPGMQRVNGGNKYIAISSSGDFLSASSGGPTGADATTITDNHVLWIFNGRNNVTTDPSEDLQLHIAGATYAAGDKCINYNGVYGVVTGGVAASSGGPSGTGNAIVDGSVTWTYMGVYTPSRYAGDFPVFTYSTVAPSNIANSNLPAQGANLYIKVAQVRAKGTLYTDGDILTVAGGTSTVPATVRASVISGNLVGLTVVNPGVYTVLPQAPTSLTGGTGSGATANLSWSVPGWYNLFGAYLAGQTGTNSQATAYTFQPAPNAAPATLSWGMEFETDAEIVVWRHATSSSTYKVKVFIDDNPYSEDVLPTPSGANNYYKFDYSATSGKKMRRWRLEWVGSDSIPAIYVDTSCNVQAPSVPDRTLAAFFGDSYGVGSSYGPFAVGNSLALRLGKLLGWSDVRCFCIGGTGYVNRGSVAGVTSDKFIARVAEALTLNPDVWLTNGSINDVDQVTLTAEATAFFQAVRAGGSRSPIIVVGVQPVNNASALAADIALEAGVTAFNDSLRKTSFISPIRNVPLPWLNGSYNNNPAPSGAVNANANNSAQYIGGDNVHMVDPGYRYYSICMADAIETNSLATLL